VAFTYGNKPVEIRHARYDTSEQHYENKLNWRYPLKPPFIAFKQ
jgi:hypothetical protein